MVGRRGGQSRNAVNAVVLSSDLLRRATLKQCRFERGLVVDSWEENKLEVSLHRGAKGDGNGGRDKATAKMKHTEAIYYAFILVSYTI